VRLHDVKIPLLLVHARDDPLVSHDDNYDWANVIQNARIITVRTSRGGHLGWQQGLFPFGPSWAVSITTDYISSVLEQISHTGWLCTVFDSLTHSRRSHHKPLASRIAHAAASHAHVVPHQPKTLSRANSVNLEDAPHLDSLDEIADDGLDTFADDGLEEEEEEDEDESDDDDEGLVF